MPNIVKVRVENPEELRNTGAYDTGALVRIQSAVALAGPFADLTGTGSTPTIVLVNGTRIYTGYDPAGAVSTWYRTRFENAGGTRRSDWSAPFQVAGENAGLLCSLYDVKQRLGETTANPADDETLLEIIGQVSFAITSYTRRTFARNPSSGTTTILFDVARPTRMIRVPKGIAEMTQLEVATETGGSFEVVPTSDWFLDPAEPERDLGWPATRIVLSDRPAGTVSFFYPGKRVVRATMAEGFPAVPLDIEGMATRASISNNLSKGSGTTGSAIVGPTGAMTVLRDLSPADMAKLDWYRAGL